MIDRARMLDLAEAKVTWAAVGKISTCTCEHRTADAAANCSERIGRLTAVVSSEGKKRMITVSETPTGRIVRRAGPEI